MHARLREGARVALVIEAEVEIVRDVPSNVAAQHLLIDAAAVRGRGLAVDVAVAGQVRARPLRTDFLAERHVERRLDVGAIEGSRRDGNVAAEFCGRPLRPDADGAARRVAAEHRALRTAQDFDAVDVDELLRQEARGADLPNAIDVGADVRDAAHAEARAAGAAGAARDDDVRYALTDLFEVVDAARLEAFARDGDDRDGHLLEILLTAGGRDDDFLETFLGRSCLIRQTTDSRQCCHDRCVDFCDFHRTPQKKRQ